MKNLFVAALGAFALSVPAWSVESPSLEEIANEELKVPISKSSEVLQNQRPATIDIKLPKEDKKPKKVSSISILTAPLQPRGTTPYLPIKEFDHSEYPQSPQWVLELKKDFSWKRIPPLWFEVGHARHKTSLYSALGREDKLQLRTIMLGLGPTFEFKLPWRFHFSIEPGVGAFMFSQASSTSLANASQTLTFASLTAGLSLEPFESFPLSPTVKFNQRWAQTSSQFEVPEQSIYFGLIYGVQ
ncbi:MAG: hypothetical protein KDD22_03725 [Bdellovibrionales bacterium]|nr:hypothetical protein [Bdellovibrionales bacterium]